MTAESCLVQWSTPSANDAGKDSIHKESAKIQEFRVPNVDQALLAVCLGKGCIGDGAGGCSGKEYECSPSPSCRC